MVYEKEEDYESQLSEQRYIDREEKAAKSYWDAVIQW